MNKVTAETLTDDEVRALARIEAAGHFRAGSPPIDPEIARLASGHMRGLAPKLVLSLVDSGLAVWTSSGLRISDCGRDMLLAALARRAGR